MSAQWDYVWRHHSERDRNEPERKSVKNKKHCFILIGSYATRSRFNIRKELLFLLLYVITRMSGD